MARGTITHVVIGVLIGAAGVWFYMNVWPSNLGGKKGA